jgi:hypothetical protein
MQNSEPLPATLTVPDRENLIHWATIMPSASNQHETRSEELPNCDFWSFIIREMEQLQACEHLMGRN